LAAADDRVRHVHGDERLGRGGALERAFRGSDGDVLVYFDTDLATDMRHLEELVDSVRVGDYDVATGSRRMPGDEQRREPERGVASTGFNTLVRLFLRSPLYDHQCGFKAFDREALFDLLTDVEDDHWFWDTEVLVRAQRAGYDVREFPVEWEPTGDTTVDLVRDVLGMGSQILRLWWQLAVRPRVDRRVTVAAGTLLVVAALALMTVYLDPREVLSAMAGADPVLVAVAAVVYLLSWPLRGLRYRDILAELGYRERVGFLTGAVFISQTGNLVFPARLGDGVRAYVVKARRDIPYP
ncbi:glycosyl transferase, partial [Halobacteriales archaeon QS_9_70_65]